MNEKLLITGGSGLLGSNIAGIAAKGFKVFATHNSNPSQIQDTEFLPLDIRDKKQVFFTFRKAMPNLVIHTAALTNVDYCETHSKEAWAVNAEGTENVALASKEVGAKLFYISTDSVFNGEQGMYVEEDTPNPINVYAKTKFEGEERARHWLSDSIIVRTAFYGWSLHNKSSLAEWVVNGLRERKTLNMFTDVFFSPIFVSNLVEVLIEMYHRNLSGIFHVAGSERCSKYVFGQEIAKSFGLNSEYVKPSSVAEAGLKARRPKDVSLNINKVSNAIHTKLLGVKEGITWFKNLENSFQGGYHEKNKDW